MALMAPNPQSHSRSHLRRASISVNRFFTSLGAANAPHIRHTPYAPRATRLACIVLLLVHAVLTVFYSLTTPLWESYDEPGHYTYARYLAQHAALPPLDVKLSDFNETHQPPLYYILAAIPIALVDTSDNVQPMYTAGGRTWVVADDKADTFPYRGTALALRLSRMVSMLISTLSVALTYAIVRTALPSRPDVALLATALHALWPLFLFLGGTVTNDIGMALFGSLTLLFVVRLWVAPGRRSRRKDYLGLALSLACAIATKDTAVSLILFVMLAVVGLLVRDRLARRPAPWLGWLELSYFVLPLLTLVLAGGVLTQGRLFRQFQIISNVGSATATAVTSAVHSSISVNTSGADSSVSIGESAGGGFLHGVIERIQSPLQWEIMSRSLLAGFSWGTLQIPSNWFDAVWGAVVLAAVGLLLALLRPRAPRSRTRLMLLLWLLCAVCVYMGPVVRGVYAGRFLFSGFSALMALFALGLLSLPRLLARAAGGYALTVVSMVALLSPWLVMAPAYQRPSLLDAQAMPDGIQIPTPVTYRDANGGAIRLLGYAHPYHHTMRGGDAIITLYWRAESTVRRDQGLRIEMFTTRGESLQTSYRATPGNNNFPTSHWQPGDTFSETYHLPLRMDAPAPSQITFKVTWFDQQTNQTLTPTCGEVSPCEPKFGALPVGLDAAGAAPWAHQPALFRLGDHIELVEAHAPSSVQAGQPLTVSLVWRANAGGLPPLTTFVHLLSAEGKPVAQGDAPPRGGLYPTTVWRAGEIVPDTYSFVAPAELASGRYRLVMGMYDAQTVERLPAFDAAGTALRDNAIPLQEISITAR
jgi:hypothetical protein